MELSIDLHNIEKGLHDLFKYAFKQNCDLDDESMTQEESKTLEELDASETLENFKDLVISLLKFKKEFKTSDKAELAQRSEQFESLLQKLEAEVRTHIRVQHQLKLHIENSQQRIDDLEKVESTDKQLIRSLEEKCLKQKTTSEQEKTRKEYDEKLKSFLEIIEKKDKLLIKNDAEISKLRNLLEEKIRECENVKKDLVKLSKAGEKMTVSASIEMIKKKWNAKKIQQSFKDRTEVKSDRKSMGDSELSKMSLSPYLKKEVVTVRKESLKSSRTHGRSNSEQKILTWKRF